MAAIPTVLFAPARTGAELTPVSDAFVFGVPWTFDLTLSESHSQEIEWTRNPLEDGTVVTDHRIVQPPELELTGWITETPLDDTLMQPDRVNSMVERLRTIAAVGDPLLIVYGTRVYADYVIESVSESRSPDGGAAVELSVSLVKLLRVSAQQVLIPPQLLAPPVKPGATAELAGGVQPAGAEVPPVAEASGGVGDESKLHESIDGALAFFGGG